MTAQELITCNPFPINETNPDRVAKIKASILENGWQGSPILVSECHGRLITGSHRLAAIKDIYDNEWDYDLDSLGDVAECVDDILETWCEENDCTINDVLCNELSTVFSGTWVEEYKDQIVEW